MTRRSVRTPDRRSWSLTTVEEGGGSPPGNVAGVSSDLFLLAYTGRFDGRYSAAAEFLRVAENLQPAENVGSVRYAAHV